VVLGAALRAKEDLSRDEGINLALLSSRELVFQEQALGFVKLWRNVVAGALALFLLFFVASAFFLSRTERSVEEKLTEFTARFNASELSELSIRAAEFNALVQAASKVAEARAPWQLMLRALERIMGEHGVTLDRLGISGLGGEATLSARAPSNDRLLSFKNALTGAAGFENVNLVVAQISTLEDNTVGFTVTFTPVFASP
jgi:Tfp pilus assembly protein PilN